MKNILGGAILILAIALIVSGKPNQAANQQKQSAQQKVAASITTKNNQSPAAHPNEPNNNSPKWYAALKRPEWWLVILAFLTLIFIAWQAWETRQAVQGSAKESVLLNRAYLTVDNWMEHGYAEGIKFRIYNPSKTAARVEEINYILQGKTVTKRYGLMLTPNESIWVVILNDEGIPHPRIENHRVIPVTFSVQGKITYRDIFRKVRHRAFARSCNRNFEGITFNIPDDVGANDEEEWNKEK